MPTATRYPTTDGTKTNWFGTGNTTNLWANVDEDPAGGGGTTSDYTSNANGDTTPIFWGFDAMPAGFDTATGVNIYAYMARPGKVSVTAYMRLTKSDESTNLTSEVSQTAPSSASLLTFSPSITGDTDKTSWDSLRLRIYGTSAVRIYALQMVVTYSEAAAGGQPVAARRIYLPFGGNRQIWTPFGR